MARRPSQNLSDAELRVLEAFRCGRITAGRLSGELARARGERSASRSVPLYGRASAPAPAPLRQAA